MTKKKSIVNLEQDPNFDISSLMETIELQYRGHSITPHMNRTGELVYRIKSYDQDYPVMHNIKSIKNAKSWIDSAVKRRTAFKPFIAYCNKDHRIRAIKVNSITKDGMEFNCTIASDDGERWGSGERFTIRKFAEIYKMNAKNKEIVAKIREQEKIRALAYSLINKLEDQLEQDDTVKDYFNEMKKEPEDSTNSNG